MDNIQNQIDTINQKLDILLDASFKQSQKREETEDFLSDLSIIGKDFYNFSVKKLEDEKVELDDEVFTKLLLKFLRDIDIFYEMLNSLENVFDLIKDLEPILNQVGRDTINKFTEFEQKGYFVYLKELGQLSDSVIKNFSIENIRLLSKRIEEISKVSKNLLDSSLLEDTLKFLEAYNEINTEKVKPAGIFKVIRTMNKPAMKKKLGFLVALLENFSEK